MTGRLEADAVPMTHEQMAEAFTDATRSVQPGETCGVCNRRVPHPKKPSSPSETHPLSFGRAPAGTVQELKDRVNALAEDAGLSKLPYPQARTVMLLLTLAEVVSRETLLEVASGMSWGTRPAE